MHVSMKSTSKIMKPCSMVDKAFEDQGFKKKMRKNNYPYYQLKLKDNCTRMSYELQIPIYEFTLNEEPFCKIQEINIEPKSKLKKTEHIPREVLTAANAKVREVISYLD